MPAAPVTATHLLIPFAHHSSPGCAAALKALALPNLGQLLTRLSLLHTDGDEASSLSPPHERALARAQGLPVQDGCIPWAAFWLAQQGQADNQAHAFVSPCFWDVGQHGITLTDPAHLQLTVADAQALLAAMQGYFAGDGMALTYLEPTRWRVTGELLRGLATASLDRVIGRNIDPWMPEAASAAPLRRLQNEMQMLLYTHPVNQAREARGLLPVNSFWLHGAGVFPGAASPSPIQTCPQLTVPALQGDWASWAQAWLQLDATECARLLAAASRGEPVLLTLCGERSAQTLQTAKTGLWRQISSLLGHKPASTLLEQL